MVNIIYQENNSVRFTQFDINTIYNLSDLKFFIPPSNTLLSLYCVFKNSANEFDSIELVPTISDSKNYDCYVFSSEQSIGLKSEELTLFLFGVYSDKTTLVSDEFNIKLNVENFNIMNQLYVMSKLNNDVAICYNKIVELTRTNINIMSDVQELKTEVMKYDK